MEKTTFTPAVFLTSGGMSNECKQFVNRLADLIASYRFTTYQYARRVGLVDGLEYLKQIFYEYQPLYYYIYIKATVLCQLLDARYKIGSIAYEFKF